MPQNKKALASMIAPEITLAYKNKTRPSDRFLLNSIPRAYWFLNETWDKSTIDLQEEFKVLLLNKGSYLLGVYNQCKGAMDSTSPDFRLIYAAALKSAATAMIIAHNHPSGSPGPSDADKKLTAELKAGATLLKIALLDHIILTRDSYYSFAQSRTL